METGCFLNEVRAELSYVIQVIIDFSSAVDKILSWYQNSTLHFGLVVRFFQRQIFVTMQYSKLKKKKNKNKFNQNFPQLSCGTYLNSQLPIITPSYFPLL